MNTLGSRWIFSSFNHRHEWRPWTLEWNPKFRGSGRWCFQQLYGRITATTMFDGNSLRWFDIAMDSHHVLQLNNSMGHGFHSYLKWAESKSQFFPLNPHLLMVQTSSGWWFGSFFIFHFIYGMSSQPHWRTQIFQDGYCTTNQLYNWPVEQRPYSSECHMSKSLDCCDAPRYYWVVF